MPNRILAIDILLFASLAGCAQRTGSQPPPIAEQPIPALVTTTPRLRTQGDLGERHRRIVADAARGGHRVAFLGASIIERWTTVGKEQWDAVWLPRHAVDCGISGDRTQDVLGRLDDGLLDALAAPNNDIEWVVLNIGSNNTDADSAADIAVGIEAIVAELRRRLPDARFVISLFPRGQWPNPLREKIADVNARLSAHYAAHDADHVQLQDLGPKFISPSGEIPPELMPDFLHPSPAGYKIWSDELEKATR
jgi:lysophospholipase L1-like esterase